LSDHHTQEAKAATPKRRLMIIFLLMALSVSTLIIVVAFFVYQKEAANLRKNIAIEQVNHLENQTTLIQDNFSQRAHDLLFLTNQIRLYQPFTTVAGLKALANDLLSFLDANEQYDQVRLLDIHGMEVLGVHYHAGEPDIVPENELQQQGGRDYFVKTIMLNANEVYVSPMVLTRKHGRGELSMKHVIRFGMPLFDWRGRKIGMIILNYFTDAMLNKFKTIAGFESPEVGGSMLLNKDGYWLSGPDTQREWGVTFADHRQNHFDITTPEAWQRIAHQKSGHFIVHGDQYFFTALYPAEMISSISRINSYSNPRQAFWKIVSRYPQTAFTIATRKLRFKIILLSLSVMLLMNGMFWFMARTIIRRRQTEDELEKLHLLEKERASHMAMLGRMSAEIAHELHQPLSAILSYTETCLRLLKTGNVQTDKLGKLLGKISGQADRAGHVVRHVGNFTRSQEMQRAPVDLNMLISETLNLAELETRKYRVKTGKKLNRRLPSVYADCLLIQQVLLNLIRNACEAMEGTEPDNRELIVETVKMDHDYVRTSVRDHGPGLTTDEMEHMFDAFFSQKKEGMGLGLSVSRSIVENHGGRLWAETLPETGAMVCFTLPIAKESYHEE